MMFCNGLMKILKRQVRILAVKNDDVRYCHSDIQLHMSGNSLSQLRYMISFACKFARLIEGKTSFEFKTANHWQTQLDNVYCDYEKTYGSNNPIVSVLRTYYD